MKHSLVARFAATALGACILGGANAQDYFIVNLANPAQTYTVAASHNLTVVDRTIGAPFAYFRSPVGSNHDVVLNALKADTRVVWAEDDSSIESPENQSGGKGSTVAVVNDRNTLYGLNSGALNKISFDPVRAALPGRAVKIAILDTGLARRSFSIWRRVVKGANFVEPGHSAYDDYNQTDSNGNNIVDEGVGHGTFVAGIIDQVAPQCPLVIVRIADSDGVSSAWKLIKGIVLATTEGCEVANVSLGSPVHIAALSDVCEWAQLRGLTIVGAAGNLNVQGAFWPSRISDNVCVSGVDAIDKKAAFANWDSGISTSAPSTGIKSAWVDGTTVVWQGTSFAAPFVTGAIGDSLRRRGRAYPSDVARVSGKAGDGINAINPSYRGKLGVRLNLTKLDNSLKNLPVRP
ncbi:MAG: S8 family serine peptidase [Fimbriimonadaceae bacterium]